MINIVLCDDNVQYLEFLCGLVSKECSKLLPDKDAFCVGGTFDSGERLIKYIGEHRVDVVLLDIDMPDMSGFEVAKIICKDYKDTKIIFMSAYDNFVYSSFEFYPFAYIRKSHVSDELPAVLGRVVKKINEAVQSVIFSTVSGARAAEVSSITHVESERNYFTVHMQNGEKLTCRGTLAEVEKKLEQYDFFRIHSAFLINFEHVERMLDNGFVLVHGASLPIAQRRLHDFKKGYMDYLRRCFGT